MSESAIWWCGEELSMISVADFWFNIVRMMLFTFTLWTCIHWNWLTRLQTKTKTFLSPSLSAPGRGGPFEKLFGHLEEVHSFK